MVGIPHLLSGSVLIHVCLAEGSFRRKTPRVQKPGSEDFNVNTNYNAYNTYDYNSYSYGPRY